MPVLHYPPVLGGFEIFEENIAKRLAKEMDIFVVTGKIKGYPSKEIRDGVKIFHTSLYTLKNFSYSSPFYILTAIPFIFFKSLKLAKKEKINLIHSHGFFSGIVGFFLSKILSIPYLITIQAADFSLYHQGILSRILYPFYRFIEKIIYKNAVLCHSVSYYLAKHYEGLGIKNNVVVPNGVEIKSGIMNYESGIMDLKRKLNIKENEKVVLTISRLTPKNGMNDLIECLNYLKEENIKLIIIGDGEQKKELEKLAAELNLKNKIIFLGEVNHKEVPEYLSLAEVFIRPSIAEGFGIVFLEAMAAGVPVIGTPVGGIVDFLKDRETGLFCKVKNPQNIAEKIKILLTDEELRLKLIESGKKLVKEEYDWENIAKKIGKIYQNI